MAVYDLAGVEIFSDHDVTTIETVGQLKGRIVEHLRNDRPFLTSTNLQVIPLAHEEEEKEKVAPCEDNEQLNGREFTFAINPSQIAIKNMAGDEVIFPIGERVQTVQELCQVIAQTVFEEGTEAEAVLVEDDGASVLAPDRLLSNIDAINHPLIRENGVAYYENLTFYLSRIEED